MHSLCPFTLQIQIMDYNLLEKISVGNPRMVKPPVPNNDKKIHRCNLGKTRRANKSITTLVAITA